MAQTFKRVATRNIGATDTAIGAYSVSSGVSVTVIGLSVANTSSTAGTVDVYVANGVTNISYIVKGAPLPVAGTLVAAGGDQKIVLQAGDYINVVVRGGATGDALMSVLELS